MVPKLAACAFYCTFHSFVFRLSPDEYSQLDITTKLAVFDALIVIWQFKTRWDAVRPFSAIPFAMKDQFIPSYIHANGSFGSVKSDEWKSYLPMPNYPEYPSATTAICYAHAEAMRRTLGTDHLKWTVDIGKKTQDFKAVIVLSLLHLLGGL